MIEWKEHVTQRLRSGFCFGADRALQSFAAAGRSADGMGCAKAGARRCGAVGPAAAAGRGDTSERMALRRSPGRLRPAVGFGAIPGPAGRKPV